MNMEMEAETLKSDEWVAPDGTTAKTKKALIEKKWMPSQITKNPERTEEIPLDPNSRDHIEELKDAIKVAHTRLCNKDEEVNKLMHENIKLKTKVQVLKELIRELNYG